MYIDLHVKYPLFLSELNEAEFSRQIFGKYSNVEIHKNPSGGSRLVPFGLTDGWKDGQRDMTKLTVAFLQYCERV